MARAAAWIGYGLGLALLLQSVLPMPDGKGVAEPAEVGEYVTMRWYDAVSAEDDRVEQLRAHLRDDPDCPMVRAQLARLLDAT